MRISTIKMSDNEFGFSLISEKEFKEKETVLNNKLVKITNTIMPLLQELSKDPEKSYILWENRVPVVNDLINEINKIVEE